MKSANRGTTGVQLAYDATGRLRREDLITGDATASTRFLYDGTDRVAEYDGAGNLLR